MIASDGDSRRSSVRALNVRPHTAITLPATSPPAAAWILSVTRSNCSSLTATTPSRRSKSYPASAAILSSARVSLGKQLPPQPGPGRRNSWPMRLSYPRPEHDVVDVGPDSFADRRDGVDERQLRRQEGVGGVLERLRRRRVGDDHRRRDAEVQRRHLDRRRLVRAADDDAVGLEEVLHRRSLAQELGVRDDLHVRAIEHPLDDPRRADRHRGLVDDDALVGQLLGDLPRGLLDVREIGAAVLALGRRHAQERDVAVAHGVGRADHEAQAPRPQALLDEPVEAVLDDRDLATGQPSDLVRVDVGARDLVAEMGEAGSGRQPDVARADDGDARHGLRRYWPSAVGHGHRPDHGATERADYRAPTAAQTSPVFRRPQLSYHWARQLLPWRQADGPIEPLDPGLLEACGVDPTTVCEWVWDRTTNETLAKLADWFIGKPLTVVADPRGRLRACRGSCGTSSARPCTGSS